MPILGLLEIVELIKGVIQFPSTILEFVKLLRKTPEEKHDEILKGIQEEAKKYEDTGRPSWN